MVENLVEIGDRIPSRMRFPFLVYWRSRKLLCARVVELERRG
jgi:hypothetical protein